MHDRQRISGAKSAENVKIVLKHAKRHAARHPHHGLVHHHISRLHSHDELKMLTSFFVFASVLLAFFAFFAYGPLNTSPTGFVVFDGAGATAPDSASVTGAFSDVEGTYAAAAADDGSYFGARDASGEPGTQLVGNITLVYDLGTLTSNNSRSISALSGSVTYCHSDQLAKCDGKKSFDGIAYEMNLFAANKVTGQHIDIGDITPTSTNTETAVSWAASGNLSEYVTDDTFTLILEFAIDSGGNGKKASFLIDAASLAAEYDEITLPDTANGTQTNDTNVTQETPQNTTVNSTAVNETSANTTTPAANATISNSTAETNTTVTDQSEANITNTTNTSTNITSDNSTVNQASNATNATVQANITGTADTNSTVETNATNTTANSSQPDTANTTLSDTAATNSTETPAQETSSPSSGGGSGGGGGGGGSSGGSRRATTIASQPLLIQKEENQTGLSKTGTEPSFENIAQEPSPKKQDNIEAAEAKNSPATGEQSESGLPQRIQNAIRNFLSGAIAWSGADALGLGADELMSFALALAAVAAMSIFLVLFYRHRRLRHAKEFFMKKK